MKIILTGNSKLLPELTELVTQAGHDVSLFSDFHYLDKHRYDELDQAAAVADLAVDYSHMRHIPAMERVMVTLPIDKPYIVSPMVSSLTFMTHTEGYHVGHPERVVGWGALPPIASPEGKGIVEVARGLQTSDAAFDVAVEFWQSLGLETVEVADGPGLVRARVLCSLMNEAVSALADGVASADDIDAAMQLGNNYPQGLLAWADELGLDLVLAVLDGIHGETGDPKYRPHPLLKRKVWAGHLGKSSGRGFFEYETWGDPASSGA